jgi:hypothetical protein
MATLFKGSGRVKAEISVLIHKHLFITAAKIAGFFERPNRERKKII